MPFDGSNFNRPERQPINGLLAEVNAQTNAWRKANSLPPDTPVKVSVVGGYRVFAVDHQGIAENAALLAAHKRAGSA